MIGITLKTLPQYLHITLTEKATVHSCKMTQKMSCLGVLCQSSVAENKKMIAKLKFHALRGRTYSRRLTWVPCNVLFHDCFPGVHTQMKPVPELKKTKGQSESCLRRYSTYIYTANFSVTYFKIFLFMSSLQSDLFRFQTRIL